MSGNWAAYAWGFLPGIGDGGLRVGHLAASCRMVQYLDMGRLPDLPPPLSMVGLIQQLFYYSAAAFIGLLLIALVQTGLTLLALSLSAMRARKGL